MSLALSLATEPGAPATGSDVIVRSHRPLAAGRMH